MSDLYAWLGALLTRKNEDQTPKFSLRDAEDLIGTVVLTTGFEAGTLPARVARALENLAHRAELDPHESLAEREERLRIYFEANPLPEELLIEFRQNVRHSLHENGPNSLGARFAAFAADAPTTAPTADAPRPEGTRPGGALGFFLAKKDLS